jgi:uncharacterized protein YgiM (DUF1202 family)
VGRTWVILALWLGASAVIHTTSAQTVHPSHDVATNTDKSAPVAASDGAYPIEKVYWQSIQKSKNAADFEAYLTRFPNGEFVALARNAIAALDQDKAAPIAPAAPPSGIKLSNREMVAWRTAFVRAAPNASAKLLFRLAEGERVTMTGGAKVSSWNAVSVKGRPEGYVLAASLEEPAAYEAHQQYLARFPNGMFSKAAHHRIGTAPHEEMAVVAAPTRPGPSPQDTGGKSSDRLMVASRTALVRVAPDTSAKLLFRLAKGERLTATATAKAGTWYAVTVKGRGDGYVVTESLEEPQTFKAHGQKRRQSN